MEKPVLGGFREIVVWAWVKSVDLILYDLCKIQVVMPYFLLAGQGISLNDLRFFLPLRLKYLEVA